MPDSLESGQAPQKYLTDKQKPVSQKYWGKNSREYNKTERGEDPPFLWALSTTLSRASFVPWFGSTSSRFRVLG